MTSWNHQRLVMQGLSDGSTLVKSIAKRWLFSLRSLPISVGIAVLAATLVLWQALVAQERANLRQATYLEAANAKFEITRQLQERTQALERMAKRWAKQGKPSKDVWEADARLYLQHYGSFQAIEWVDPSFYVRWIVPVAGNEAAQNLNLGFEARRKMALELARNQRQVMVTRTINLKQGGKGIQVYAPIFQEEFAGFIAGVFRTQEFLDTIFNDLDKQVGRRYGLTIFDGDEPIYSRYLDKGLNEKRWGQDTTITFNGVTWRMRVWPEQELLAQERTPLPTVVLIAGLLMAVVLPVAIDLAQIARRRTKTLVAVNQKLEGEICDRNRAEKRLSAQYITARALAESITLSEATSKILQALCDTLKWDVSELWSVNQQANVLDLVKVWHQPSVEVPEFEAVSRTITFAPGVGLPGYVWEKGEPMWTADILQDCNVLRATIADKAGLHEAFGFPILGNKEVVGVITFFSREIRQPDRDLLETVTAIGRQIGQFIERKQAEEALEQQRQWLEVTLASIGDAVIATDTAGFITFMNPVAEALTGWTLQDACGRKIDEVFCIIHQYTRQPAEIPIERALREGVVVELADNTALIARDRTEIPIDDSCASIRDQNGTVQGAVLIFRDITKRKQAAEALQKSEQRYRSVVNTVKDVIFQTDTTGIWIFLNPAWTEITGFSLEESIGTNFLDYVHPDDRQLNLEGFNSLIAGQKEYYRQEIRHITKDGGFHWMEVFARLRVDANDTVIGTSGTLHDITERKRAEEEIHKALEKEKELNELKSRFVSMTSHEFRTPLTAILGSAELLEHYGHKWSEEKKLTHLHRIQSTVKHVTHLLDDVLLIGKADAGRIEFNPEAINLEQFCLSLVEELQLGSSSKHTLSFVSQGECTDACMDEKLLRHILSNLLSNAIKYSPAGGTVHFELTCQNGEAIFQIRDEGIGIPSDDLKRLFETFHRATNVGKIAGTGLGLAIVKRSVDLHNGKIAVASEVKVGTTFTITLPLKPRVQTESSVAG